MWMVRRGDKAADVNYWGITFAADDLTFYATLPSTGGKTWLMRGDMGARTLTALRENVECPSLSPDGGRIAYKHRDRPDHWRLHVLDLGDKARTSRWPSRNTSTTSRPGSTKRQSPTAKRTPCSAYRRMALVTPNDWPQARRPAALVRSQASLLWLLPSSAS